MHASRRLGARFIKPCESADHCLKWDAAAVVSRATWAFVRMYVGVPMQILETVKLL